MEPELREECVCWSGFWLLWEDEELILLLVGLDGGKEPKTLGLFREGFETALVLLFLILLFMWLRLTDVILLIPEETEEQDDE